MEFSILCEILEAIPCFIVILDICFSAVFCYLNGDGDVKKVCMFHCYLRQYSLDSQIPLSCVQDGPAKGLTKRRRADRPDDGSDGLARMWRTSVHWCNKCSSAQLHIGRTNGNQTLRTIDYSYHRRFILGRFVPSLSSDVSMKLDDADDKPSTPRMD